MFKPTKDQYSSWSENPHLFTQETTPLSTRIASEKPHLTPGLCQLRVLLGDEKFTAYIETLHNINKSGATLLITTGNELRRTYVERECLPHFKKAFDVRLVRVVALR